MNEKTIMKYGPVLAILFSVCLAYAIYDETIGESYRRSQPKDYWPWADIDVVVIRELENGTHVFPPQEYYYNTSIRRWELHVFENNATSIHVLDRRYSR